MVPFVVIWVILLFNNVYSKSENIHVTSIFALLALNLLKIAKPTKIYTWVHYHFYSSQKIMI